jgi:hypothetical protein
MLVSHEEDLASLVNVVSRYVVRTSSRIAIESHAARPTYRILWSVQ